MYEHCPQCALVFEREPGYFIGAMYINYGITAVTVIAGHFILDAMVPLALSTHLVLWSTVAALLPLLMFRHSRSLWLSLDFAFDPVDQPLRSVR